MSQANAQVIIIATTSEKKGEVNESAAILARQAIGAFEPKTDIIITIAPATKVAGVMDLLTMDKIHTDLLHLETLINQDMTAMDVPQVIDYMCDVSGWAGYAGKVQACAKAHLASAMKCAVEQMPESVRKLSASVQLQWVKGQAGDYEAMHEFACRISSALSHRLDAIRSVVSYEKAVLPANLVPNGGNNQKK